MGRGGDLPSGLALVGRRGFAVRGSSRRSGALGFGSAGALRRFGRCPSGTEPQHIRSLLLLSPSAGERTRCLGKRLGAASRVLAVERRQRKTFGGRARGGPSVGALRRFGRRPNGRSLSGPTSRPEPRRGAGGDPPKRVPWAGLEPARPCGPRILSPLCLPVSPPGRRWGGNIRMTPRSGVSPFRTEDPS